METKNNWKAWLYLAPVLVLLAVFTFYPLINTIIIAFLKSYNPTTDSVFSSIARSGLTFDNFGRVLGITPTVTKVGENVIKSYQTEFVKYALPNTFLIVFVTVPLSIALSLLIAVGLNSIKVLSKVLQTVFFVPYVTNSIAVGMVFAVIFANDNGLWNAIFHLGSKNWVNVGASWGSSMFALCVYIIWHALPYKILIFLSGLQGIDKQYYQAAKIDAASRVKTFFRVTVPLLSPQIVYVLITSLIGSFKEYSSVVGLFGSDRQGTSSSEGNLLTVVYYIYQYANNPLKTADAAAGAVILFIIIMFFTFIQKVVLDKRTHY